MRKRIIPVLIILAFCLLAFASCGNKCEHEYIETVVPSTCKSNGFTQKLCSKCGDEQLSNYKPYGAHNGEWTVKTEPTCQSTGVEEKMCLTCNVIVEVRSISKLGHVSGEWKTTKTPTCNETGMEKLFCNACGIDLETKTLSVTDEHDFRTEITEPTTESEGYTTYTCKVCDFVKKDDFVSKLESPSEPETVPTPGEIYQLVAESTVRIDVYDKSGKRYALGSGFFISDDGKIATNYHVIKGACKIKVTLYSDNSQHDVVSVLGYNKTQDVAVIQIDFKNESFLSPAKDEIKVGDTVYTLGSPKGVNNVFTSGIISNTGVQVTTDKNCIAFTAPISSGNSGGPLVNYKGEVIGINTMRIIDAENFNLAVKYSQVEALNTANPTTTSELYAETLAENAFDILSINTMINAHYVQEDEYCIYQSVAESNGEVGLDIYYIFNSKTEIFTQRVYIVKNSKRLYMAEIQITGVSDGYSFALYDISMGQYTVEATIHTNNPCTSFQTDFNSLFEIYSIRYTEGDNLSVENAKKLCFDIYTYMALDFKELLKKSNTGITVSHFNFNI